MMRFRWYRRLAVWLRDKRLEQLRKYLATAQRHGWTHEAWRIRAAIREVEDQPPIAL